MIKDLKSDMKELLTKEEFRVLHEKVMCMDTGLNRSISKDEVMVRINALNEDFNAKLAERPTIDYFRKIVNQQNDKMDRVQDVVDVNMDKLD